MKARITYLLCSFMLFGTLALRAQKSSEFICDKGKVHFLASTPIEDIEASSNSAACAINTQTKKIAAKVALTTFEFRRKKMQDDFNEDYVESTKYPYATLEAVITSPVNFTKDGTYNVTLKGTFEIHGVKAEREIKGTLVVRNGGPASATAKFDVKLVDHKIKVPTLVVAKIAEVVQVDVHFEFTKQ